MFDFYLNFEIRRLWVELEDETSPDRIAWSGRRCTREELVGNIVFRRIGESTETSTWPVSDWGRRHLWAVGNFSPSVFKVNVVGPFCLVASHIPLSNIGKIGPSVYYFVKSVKFK